MSPRQACTKFPGDAQATAWTHKLALKLQTGCARAVLRHKGTQGLQHKDSHTALLGPERVYLDTYRTNVAAHSRSPKQRSPN